jgi:hypothetical protein
MTPAADVAAQRRKRANDAPRNRVDRLVWLVAAPAADHDGRPANFG